VYPNGGWARRAPGDLGFRRTGLERARRWFEEHRGERPGRLLVVRDGAIAAEWNRGLDPDRPVPVASAAKSLYSNVLGVAVAEGRIPSADARVCDYYPEMMDVPEGCGPKAGRHAFEKDRDITFRQLISNTSGYMKPGEEPGKVFHYQTFGMNVLTHALAKIYGLYDVDDPEGSPGFARLIEEKVAAPIGARGLKYSLTNFNLPENARRNIFGYYSQVHANPRDLARFGWLWCRMGRWEGVQVVPEDWMRASVRTNPDLIANGREEERRYGYGFWTNDHGKLWPNLPRDGFTASGAGGHYVSVFPRARLVVVQNPGPYVRTDPDSGATANPALLEILLEALRE